MVCWLCHLAERPDPALEHQKPMFEPVPIFIISYNRGAYLAKVCASYRLQAHRTRLIIHDNGSDDEATLDILCGLEQAGVEVFRRSKIDHAGDLNLVDATVREFSQRESYFGPYVVTDCDIDLSDTGRNALLVYRELLEQFPQAKCVGPMLTIADVPKSYPLFQHAMNRHVDQFWSTEPHWIDTRFGTLAVRSALIDTTFALHRPREPFRRGKMGIRVYHPFEARHLDWYLDAEIMSTYAKTSSSNISHWDNWDQIRQWRCLPKVVRSYKIVAGEIGALRVVERTTADNPD